MTKVYWLALFFLLLDTALSVPYCQYYRPSLGYWENIFPKAKGVEINSDITLAYNFLAPDPWVYTNAAGQTVASQEYYVPVVQVTLFSKDWEENLCRPPRPIFCDYPRYANEPECSIYNAQYISIVGPAIPTQNELVRWALAAFSFYSPGGLVLKFGDPTLVEVTYMSGIVNNSPRPYPIFTLIFKSPLFWAADYWSAKYTALPSSPWHFTLPTFLMPQNFNGCQTRIDNCPVDAIDFPARTTVPSNWGSYSFSNPSFVPRSGGIPVIRAYSIPRLSTRRFLFFAYPPIKPCGTGDIAGGTLQFPDYSAPWGAQYVNWRVGKQLAVGSTVRYTPTGPLLNGKISSHWFIDKSNTVLTRDCLETSVQPPISLLFPVFYSLTLDPGWICAPDGSNTVRKVYRGGLNIGVPYARIPEFGQATSTDLGALGRTVGLFNSSTGKLAHVLIDAPVPVSDTTTTQTASSSPGFAPDDNFITPIPLSEDGNNAKFINPSTRKLTFPSYTVRAFVGPTSSEFPSDVEFSTGTIEADTKVLPPSISSAQLVIDRPSGNSDYQLAVNVSTTTHFDFGVNGLAAFRVTDTGVLQDVSRGTIGFSCPMCSTASNLALNYRILFPFNFGSPLDRQLCVCLDILATQRIVTADLRCTSSFLQNPSFRVTSWLRTDLFTYTFSLSSDKPILIFYTESVRMRCNSLSPGTVLVSSITLPVPGLIRIVTQMPCPGFPVFEAGQASALTANSWMADTAMELRDGASLTNPTTVLVRTDGIIAIQFPQNITSFQSAKYLLYFVCPTGTADSALSGTVDPSDRTILRVTHIPCPVYSGQVTVKLVSSNILFDDKSRSSAWEGFGTLSVVPAFSRLACRINITTIFLTATVWEHTAPSVHLKCVNGTYNATILSEAPMSFDIANPLEAVDDNCTIEFTLELPLKQYLTLVTTSFFVCSPSLLAPSNAYLYPGVRELYVQFPLAGTITQSTIVPSLFLLSCGNQNATLSTPSVTNQGKTVLLKVGSLFNYTNCSESPVLRVLSNAFETTGFDVIDPSLSTNVSVQSDVRVTSVVCRTEANSNSQNLVYLSGEWDLISTSLHTPCNLRAISSSDNYLSFTVSMYRYQSCTSSGVFVSPGPRTWTVSVTYGSCTQMPTYGPLAFRYVFAANQDKSLSIAQTQTLSYVSDNGVFGVGTLDFFTDSIRYKKNSIGVEYFSNKVDQNNYFRLVNSVSRGDFRNLVRDPAAGRYGSYTFIAWVKLKREGSRQDYQYDISPVFMGITKGAPPPTTAFLNSQYDDGVLAVSCTIGTYPMGMSIAAIPVSNTGGDPDYATLAFKSTWQRVDQTCDCRRLMPDPNQEVPSLIDYYNRQIPLGPWAGTRTAGSFNVGPSLTAETPVTMIAARMETDSSGQNVAGDIYYYTKDGKKKYLPSGALNLFQTTATNCTPPTLPGSSPSGICAGFNPVQYPFCAVGPDQAASKFVMFPAFDKGRAFLGETYLAEMYDAALSEETIDQIWANGLPNSMPYTEVTQISSLEDQTIDLLDSLQPYDFDQVELGYDQNVSFASYTLVSGRGNVSVNETTGRVLFSPVYCTFGDVYATFTATLTDGIDVSRAFSFTIKVTHVNHAPSSVNTTVRALLYAYTTITLSGQDCDTTSEAADEIVLLEILSPPERGTLFVPVTLEKISTFPRLLDGSKVVYLPNDTIVPVGGQDVFDQVSFSFVVSDKGGLSSGVTFAFVDIANNLQPGTPPRVSVLEDSSVVFTITSGFDTTGAPVTYYIWTLPFQGTLFLGSTAVTLADVPLLINDTLRYAGCADCWGDDWFLFVCQSNRSFHFSPIGNQTIYITEVNDPPILVGPSADQVLQGYTLAPADQRLRLTVNASDIDSDREFTTVNGFRVQLTVSRGAVIGLDPDVKTRLALDPLVISFRGNFEEDENPSIWFQFPKRLLSGLLANMSILCGETGVKTLNIILSDQHTSSFTDTNSATLDVPFECLDGSSIFGVKGGTSVLGIYVILAWSALAVCLGGCCFYCAWNLFLRKYLRDRAKLANKVTGKLSGRLTWKDLIFGGKKTKAKHEQVAIEEEEPEVEQALLH